MAWNLQTIMSRVTGSLGKRADFAASDVSFWVNEAQREIWDALPQNLQEGLAVSSTTSGENRISLPTDFQESLFWSNMSFNPPIPIQPLPLGVMDSLTTLSGVPRYRMEYADWVELYPIPDSAYSIQLRYRKRLSDMTALTSMPSVDTAWHMGVFLKSKELVASHLALDPVVAAQAAGELARFVADAPTDRAKRQREMKMAAVSVPRFQSNQRVAYNSDDTYGRWP